ncbi:MAG: hypothetical protein ACYCU0_13390 [Solirubrobacteraceae bacterium]
MTEQSTLPAASFEPSLDALVNLEDVERLAAAALEPATSSEVSTATHFGERPAGSFA